MVSEGLGLGYRATVVCMGSNRQSISATEIQVAHVDQQHTSVHKATEKRGFFGNKVWSRTCFWWFLTLLFRRSWILLVTHQKMLVYGFFFHVVVVLASLRERHNGTVDEPKAKVLRDHHNGLSMDSGISVWFSLYFPSPIDCAASVIWSKNKIGWKHFTLKKNLLSKILCV